MKILVAVDGSPNALRALEHAIALAGRLAEPAELVLVNAHDDVALRGAGQFVGKEAVDGYLNDLSRDELKEAVDLAASSKVPFRTRLLRGPISQSIAQAAGEEHCDLIVLGSKGRSALKDLLIGSVAQRVAALAEAPVTLVR